MEILILYSEYSKKCKKFLNTLNNDPVIDIKKLNKLCIDNPEIREIVVKHVKKVPAVMVKTDNDIELYEADEAFDWLISFSEQLYNQLEAAEEKKIAEINARIEAEAAALAEAKLKELKEQQPQQPQSPVSSKNVKQQAKIIAQDRSNLSFSDEQPDTGTHVSQVKSVSDTMSISEQVKHMEKEREAEEREIQKRRQMSMT
jgi:Ser-tRNA(Ala) deacylase AlaX